VRRGVFLEDHVNVGRQITGILSTLWGALLLVPFVVLAHSEYRGLSQGWIHASLDAGHPLHAWTLHRLELWGVLYALGTGLLWLARRRDPGRDHLAVFAMSLEARIVLGAALVVLLALLTVATPADCALYLVGVVAALFMLWASSASGQAMLLRARRFIAAGGSVALCLAIGEVVFRLPGIVERTGGSLEARDALWNRTDFRSVTAGNSLQLRSQHVGKPKSDGVTRILAIGDSFTAGDWVDTVADTWPGALEAELSSRAISVEVINAGFGGMNTEMEAQYLEDVGWMFSPDVVVLQYTLNDTGGGDAAAMPLVPMLDPALRRKSHLYSWMNQRFRAVQVGLRGAEDLSRYFADDWDGWQRSRAALLRIAAQARERGVPLMLVVYPWLSTNLDEESYPYRGVHAKLAGLAAEAGIPFLDLHPALAEANPQGRDWWARPFDAHPSGVAHRLAAKAIAAKLIEENALRR
jgi:lysophospholipase L1-like esterase